MGTVRACASSGTHACVAHAKWVQVGEYEVLSLVSLLLGRLQLRTDLTGASISGSAMVIGMTG